MKILILVPRFPYPPRQGDCIRAWNEIHYLSERHDVWLAVLDRAPPAPDALAHVRAVCRAVAVFVRSDGRSLARGVTSLLGGRSLTEGYFFDARLATCVQRWGVEVGFDAVLTFSPGMAPYASLLRAARRVLDMNDVESARWESYAGHGWPPLRWLYALEAHRLQPAERVWIHSHDVTVLVNECERSKLPRELQTRAVVIRTGLDLARYTPAALGDAVTLPSGEPVVGFVGSMSYAPNVRGVLWFARSVWPRIRRTVPDARLLIVGRNPTRAIRRLARHPNVQVTGFVADVRPYLARMRVFVCPMREQIGVQTKLVEALAAARPAVVTPPAADGVEYQDPPPFLVAASAHEFAHAVVALLRDPAQARACARRARATAEAYYDAADQMARLEQLLGGADVLRCRTLPSRAPLHPQLAVRRTVLSGRTTTL